MNDSNAKHRPETLRHICKSSGSLKATKLNVDKYCAEHQQCHVSWQQVEIFGTLAVKQCSQPAVLDKHLQKRAYGYPGKAEFKIANQHSLLPSVGSFHLFKCPGDREN